MNGSDLVRQAECNLLVSSDYSFRSIEKNPNNQTFVRFEIFTTMT
jgi:hypothetical protein